MIVLFGIKTCDTCRKARAWLDGQGIDHRFHDLRADGLNEDMLDRWIDAAGWEVLLNRRSTTWRALPEIEKADLDAEKARDLMLANPTLIKRPVWDLGGRVEIGFTDRQRAVVSSAA